MEDRDYPSLQDLVPSKVALAYDANHIAERMLFSRLPQAELHDEPGLLWYATGSDAIASMEPSRRSWSPIAFLLLSVVSVHIFSSVVCHSSGS